MIKGIIIMFSSMGFIFTFGLLNHYNYINTPALVSIPLIIISFFITLYGFCIFIEEAHNRIFSRKEAKK